MNTVLFIAAMAGFRGLATDEIIATVKSVSTSSPVPEKVDTDENP